MILQSVRIESWKCFNRTAKFDFNSGLNIVHAPNGSGKSSLFEAIRDAFLEYSSSKNKSLKAIIPWGTSLGPFVEIYFMDHGQEYRLTKKFFQKSNSELYTKSGESFIKKFESKSADEEVMRILNGSLNVARLSSKEKWPLSKILLAPQGDLAIKGLSEDLKNNIRLSLNTQLTGAGSFEDAIEKKYFKYFSEKDRTPRRGNKVPVELFESKNELDEVSIKRDNANIAYNDFEGLSQKVAELRKNYSATKNKLEKHQQDLAKLLKRQGDFQNLSTLKETKQLENSNAQKTFEQVDRTLTTIDNLLKKISEIKYEIDKTENDIPKKQKESEDARVTFVKCENQLSKLRELEKELEGHRLLIKDARSFVKTKDLLKGLVTKKSCADVIVKEIELSKSLRSQTVAPDKKTLKKIKELAANIDASRMKIDSAMMRIEIKPEKSFSLEVIEADQTGSCNLSENEIFTVQGTPAIVARIPGVATMKISGPSVSIEQDKKSLDVDQRKLDEILRPFTTNNIAELEALTERAEELDDKINDREKDLKRELGSYSLNDLDSEIITLRKDVHETIVKVPQWETVLPDPDQMEEEYGTQKKQLDQKRSELSSARDVAQKNALETKGNLEQARKDLNRRKDELETSQQELDKENEDGKTREQRIKERSEISIKCTATQKEFDDAVRKLKHFGEDPQLQIDILQPMVSESETQAERDKEELQRTEGKLEDAAGKVSYSEKISLEEKVYQCQERYDRELLRQNAIKLLMDTMTRCREKVFSGVSEPVEKRATEIIKRIGDVKFSVVGLKQDFEPKEIQPAMTSDPVTIQSISGGENEQLHLAVRIALAETLIKTDRHFMLLDDVLTATDSCRMDRILGILEELTERFQIIVLTCHPDRYQKLLSAHFIDLLSA